MIFAPLRVGILRRLRFRVFFALRLTRIFRRLRFPVISLARLPAGIRVPVNISLRVHIHIV
jgi:hypothetical protein